MGTDKSTITVAKWLALPVAKRPPVRYRGEEVQDIWQDKTWITQERYILYRKSWKPGVLGNSHDPDTVLEIIN